MDFSTGSPMSDRFKPTRAGVINVWDYVDEEWVFADGRLALRGHNGSGKTKALEVLFPFVLDGVADSRRLDPFSGENRTMKSNLLYRGQESEYGYVWMEFARCDGGPQARPPVTAPGDQRPSRSSWGCARTVTPTASGRRSTSPASGWALTSACCRPTPGRLPSGSCGRYWSRMPGAGPPPNTGTLSIPGCSASAESGTPSFSTCC